MHLLLAVSLSPSLFASAGGLRSSAPDANCAQISFVNPREERVLESYRVERALIRCDRLKTTRQKLPNGAPNTTTLPIDGQWHPDFEGSFYESRAYWNPERTVLTEEQRLASRPTSEWLKTHQYQRAG